jgi:ribosome maturation protein SDO1
MMGERRLDFGKYIVANIKLAGRKFEILVDPDKAWDLKKNIRVFQKDKERETNRSYKVTVDDVLELSKVPMQEIMQGHLVFEDIRRGEKMSEEFMVEAFGTEDIRRIIAEILLNGELQLTKEQREKFISEKKKQLLSLLIKNCVNPQTNKPHPQARIEKALEEAKVNIDPFTPIEDQLTDIIRSLKTVIPIKMERAVLSLSVPAEFTGKAYNLITTLASISKENWKDNGVLECVVELPAGMQVEFLDKINKLTRGRTATKVLESKGI